MRAGEFFGALRERQFRLLWLGQATSTLGDGLVPVALAFAVIESLDRGPTALGIVLAAQSLPLVVFVLAGGVWADRLPRQMVMLVSDSVRGLVQATLAVLLLTETAEVWQLALLMAIYGTAQAFFQPAATGLVPATISPQRLQQANALLGLSRSLAFVVGPAVAGVIAATTNPGIVFAFDAVTFAVSATSLALLRLSRSRRGQATELLRRPQGRLARARLAHVALGDRRLGVGVPLCRRRAVHDARPGHRQGIPRRPCGVGDDRRRLGHRHRHRGPDCDALEAAPADARLLRGRAVDRAGDGSARSARAGAARWLP